LNGGDSDAIKEAGAGLGAADAGVR